MGGKEEKEGCRVEGRGSRYKYSAHKLTKIGFPRKPFCRHARDRCRPSVGRHGDYPLTYHMKRGDCLKTIGGWLGNCRAAGTVSQELTDR
jgi:hypothetical protein